MLFCHYFSPWAWWLDFLNPPARHSPVPLFTGHAENILFWSSSSAASKGEKEKECVGVLRETKERERGQRKGRQKMVAFKKVFAKPFGIDKEKEKEVGKEKKVWNQS